jgi:hypothetical protein
MIVFCFVRSPLEIARPVSLKLDYNDTLLAVKKQ